MSLCCIVGYKWVTVEWIKFKCNDTITLYTKNDSEQRQSVSLGYFILYVYWYYLLLIR